MCQRVNSARLRFGSDPVKSRCGTERAGPVKSGKAKENPTSNGKMGKCIKEPRGRKECRMCVDYSSMNMTGRMDLGCSWGCALWREREIGVESVLWNGWPDLWTMATGSLLLCGGVSRT